MKVKYLTLFCTALALATSSNAAAQSNSDPTQVKLSPPMLTLLCKEFPLNSRCNSSTSSGTSAPSSITQPNPSPSSSSTEPNTTPSNTTQPSTSAPNNTTGPGTNSPNNTSGPGTTNPPVGTPPAPGSQNKPYVTPQ